MFLSVNSLLLIMFFSVLHIRLLSVNKNFLLTYLLTCVSQLFWSILTHGRGFQWCFCVEKIRRDSRKSKNCTTSTLLIYFDTLLQNIMSNSQVAFRLLRNSHVRWSLAFCDNFWHRKSVPPIPWGNVKKSDRSWPNPWADPIHVHLCYDVSQCFNLWWLFAHRIWTSL